MYKETLRSIDGVSIFPVIAILIFIIFFLIVLYFTFRMEKNRVSTYAALPLVDEQESPFTPIRKTKKSHA